MDAVVGDAADASRRRTIVGVLALAAVALALLGTRSEPLRTPHEDRRGGPLEALPAPHIPAADDDVRPRGMSTDAVGGGEPQPPSSRHSAVPAVTSSEVTQDAPPAPPRVEQKQGAPRDQSLALTEQRESLLTCPEEVAPRPLVRPAEAPSLPAFTAMQDNQQHVVTPVHASCFPNGNDGKCGVLVNVARRSAAGGDDTELLRAALVKISVWREIPFVNEMPVAVVTTAAEGSIDAVRRSVERVDNVRVISIPFASKPAESVGEGGGSTPAAVFQLPFEVFEHTPFQRTMLVNASFDFRPRRGRTVTTRFAPSTWALHLLDYFDVVGAPIPDWELGDVQEVVHKARARAYAARGGGGSRTDEDDFATAVEVNALVVHPALLLVRRGDAADEFMRTWRDVHYRDGGACRSEDTVAGTVSRGIALDAPEACSLVVALETTEYARFTTFAPHHCSDRRWSGAAADACAFEKAFDAHASRGKTLEAIEIAVCGA